MNKDSNMEDDSPYVSDWEPYGKYRNSQGKIYIAWKQESDKDGIVYSVLPIGKTPSPDDGGYYNLSSVVKKIGLAPYKEYDIGRQNIHHHPSFKSTSIEMPGKPIHKSR
jgi:hypothetical protein